MSGVSLKKPGEFYYADFRVGLAKHVAFSDIGVPKEFDVNTCCYVELHVVNMRLSKALIRKDYYQEAVMYVSENRDSVLVRGNVAQVYGTDITVDSKMFQGNLIVKYYGGGEDPVGSFLLKQNEREFRIALSSDLDAATFDIPEGVDRLVIFKQQEGKLILFTVVEFDPTRYTRTSDKAIGRFMYYKETADLDFPAYMQNCLKVRYYNKVIN